MPFLTPEGLLKLQKFKEAVKKIAETKYEEKNASSQYSKEMATHALKIIDILEKNNNVGDIVNLTKKIQPSILVIDNKSFTAIPTIFNSQSLDLAMSFKNFLNDIKKDFDKNVGSIISFLLTWNPAVGKPEALIEQHIREIEANILIYTELVSSKEKAVKAHAMKTKIMNDVFGQGKESETETFFAKLKTEEYKEEDFQSEYKTKIKQCLTEIVSVPYMSIAYFPRYINQKEPYKIDLEKLKSSAIVKYGQDILFILSELENDMNVILNKKGWKEVSVISNFIKEFVTIEKINAYKSEILKLYDRIEKEIQILTGGKRFIFSYSVDPQKKQLLDNILSEIKKSKESKLSDELSLSLINVYIAMHDAGNKSRELFDKNGKKLNYGRTSALIRKYAPLIINLINVREWGNDEGLCFSAQLIKKLKSPSFKEAKEQLPKLAEPSVSQGGELGLGMMRMR